MSATQTGLAEHSFPSAGYGAFLAEFAKATAAIDDVLNVDGHSNIALPGMVQTPEYARSIMGAALSSSPVEQRLALRVGFAKNAAAAMERGTLRLRSVVPQKVLEQGAPEIMVPQLDHLLQFIDRWGTQFALRVIPSELWPYPGNEVNWHILTWASGSQRMFLSQSHTECLAQHTEEVEPHDNLPDQFGHIWRNVALDDVESFDLIRRVKMGLVR